MTDDAVNPRRPMAMVLLLALVAGVTTSEMLKAIPGMLAGNVVHGLVFAATVIVAFFSISLIAFIVYAMDRASDRIAHPIPLFDRLLEANRGR